MIRKKRIIIIIILLLLPVIQAGAQIVVRDRNTKEPIPYVSVLKIDGGYIGYTDDRGILPNPGKASSLLLSCLGYKTLDVSINDIDKGKDLYMIPVSYPLAEVVVEKPEVSRLKLTCFGRQYVVSSKPVKAANSTEAHDLFLMEEACILYIPYNENSIGVTTSRNLGYRMISGEITHYWNDYGYEVGISRHTILDLVRNKDKYVLEQSGNVTKAFPKAKKPFFKNITILKDSLTHTVQVYYEEANGYSRSFQYVGEDGKDIHVKGRRNGSLIHEIYRYRPNKKTTMADLVAYSEAIVHDGIDKQTQDPFYLMTVNEYYPVKAEYLTKEEYKEEKKRELKATQEEIEIIKQKAQVQDLSPVVKEKLDKLDQLDQSGILK